MFFISFEVFQNRRVALASSLLYAFYAPSFIFTIRAWSEPAFTLILAGFTLMLLRALRQPSISRFALSGAILGLAVLARPVMQFYPLVVLLLIAWTLNWRWRQIFPHCAAFVVAFAIILLPWTIRNLHTFKTFVPVTSYKGIPFFQSHFALNEPDYLRYRPTTESHPALRKTLESRFGPAPESPDIPSYIKAKGLNEYELDRIAFQEALEMVRTYPDRYVAVSVVRFFRLWFGKQLVESWMGGRLSSVPMITLINGTLLALALASVVYRREDWMPAAAPLVILIAYNTAIYMATLGLPRFIVPIFPMSQCSPRRR